MPDPASTRDRRDVPEQRWWVVPALLFGGIMMALVVGAVTVSLQRSGGWGYDFAA